MNTQKGQLGQTNVKQKLRAAGFNVRQMDYNCHYDLLVNGLRVKVKRATPNRAYRWFINIHRHGKLTEEGTDIYIFCLDGIPGNAKMPIYLVYRSPLETYSMSYSFSSLLRRDHPAIDNWDLMRGKEKSFRTGMKETK